MAVHRGLGHAGAGTARRQGERVEQRPQFEWLARAGLAARGVVYAVIAVLALELALGEGGKATNQKGALQTIAHGPFGKALLVLVAIGLLGYAAWRLVRAAVGHGREDDDSTKDRVSGAVSGIAYGILCVTAVKILVGASSGSGTPKKATGGVLDWPGGQVLVVVAGLVMLGVAGYQIYKGIKRKFLDSSKTEEMGEQVERGFTVLGVAGHLARGVVFALIGYGLIHAAITYDADKAVGLDGALKKLANASYGPVLLGVVAAGLLAFAAYSAADARYRKV